MRPSVILMGSKPGSVVALNTFLEKGWDVKCVVVSRKNTYPWINAPTLEEEAIKHGIKIYVQSEMPEDLIADFVISYMFRYRVKNHVIKMAKKAALNFHAGPLPEYGGWAFYNLAILEDASEYGCTCHHMDEGFDTGALLKVRKFVIKATEETAYSLEKKSQQEMILLFAEFCEMAEKNIELPKLIQDKSKMRYLNQDEFNQLKEIPLGTDKETKQRIARAFWYPPYECAYILHDDIKVEVVPDIVKEQLATLLHNDDLKDLTKMLK